MEEPLSKTAGIFFMIYDPQRADRKGQVFSVLCHELLRDQIARHGLRDLVKELERFSAELAVIGKEVAEESRTHSNRHFRQHPNPPAEDSSP